MHGLQQWNDQKIATQTHANQGPCGMGSPPTTCKKEIWGVKPSFSPIINFWLIFGSIGQ